jgi:5-methylcytosine-specific restriction endonuclease McrA
MNPAGHAGRRPTPVRPGPGPSVHREPEAVRHIGVLRVLLLNASHEPLAVVTGRRALVLVVAGKAECLVARSSEQVRSPSVALAVPAVVRLRRYVRVPYQAPPTVTRAGVLKRDGRRCAYCQGRADTVDHVVPRSRGGGHTWENCVACCVRCNARKADRLLDELGWALSITPGPPRRGVLGRMWANEESDPAWEPWLPSAA